MSSDASNEKSATSAQSQAPGAAEHVADAHRILSDMQQRSGGHPELDEAIAKLEMALSILTTKTGGML